MLRSVARSLVLVVLVVAGLVGPGDVSAVAACPGGGGPVVGDEGDFEIGDETCPEDDDDHSTPSTPGGGGTGEVRCYWVDREVSCTSKQGLGVWNGECYVRVIESEPTEGSDYYFLWEGRDEGYIVLCTPWPCEAYEGTPEAFPGYGCGAEYSWQQDAPEIVGEVGPSPLELAERAVARMDLDMGAIGSTPPSTEVDGASVGIVGMPVWLWVSNPAENTTGPITRTETDGGLTVSATGTLDRTEWTLAVDGEVYATTTCRGTDAPGTAWSEAATGRGAQPSPTCGFPGQENRHAGTITVSGTAYWSVDWAGGGQSGTIDVPGQEGTATLSIGEAQVLVQ